MSTHLYLYSVFFTILTVSDQSFGCTADLDHWGNITLLSNIK